MRSVLLASILALPWAGVLPAQEPVVDVADEVLKATVCRRDYKRYSGLSDILFTSALVGHPGKGFIFNLDLSGTDAATASRLIGRFLQEIEWQR